MQAIVLIGAQRRGGDEGKERDALGLERQTFYFVQRKSQTYLYFI